jgi:hypothetical protein
MRMLRNSWILGLIAGLGLFAQAHAAQADELFGGLGDSMTLGFRGNVDTMPVNWGLFGRGCSTCGAGYYALYGGQGYYGASAYGYGYAPQSYWGGGWGGYNYGSAYAPTGYWGASAAPAGYWAGYGASYNQGWGYSGVYGAGYPAGYSYGAGYPGYYGTGCCQPYAASYYVAPTYYYAPSAYYYQPAATLAVPYAYATPPVANVFATTSRVTVAYPQSAPIQMAPQVAPAMAPYPPAAPPAQGFDYNGGPSRLVPMPRTDPQPAPIANPMIYNIRLSDDAKAPSSKYAFKGYGEKSADSSTSGTGDTVLVKGAGNR